MAKNRLKLKLIFLIVLIIYQLSDRTVQAEDDEDSGEAKAKTPGKAPAADPDDKVVQKMKFDKSKIGQAIKEKLEKAKQRKKPLDGQTGKVMKFVMETIKEVNPVRLIQKIDPEPLSKAYETDKFKIPSAIFSNTFFDKLSQKTKLSKAELSKELGSDVEQRKEGQFFILSTILAFGSKQGLSLGDYFDFLGLDLKDYEKKYDEYMIETVRRPVEVIDELLTEGFTEYIEKVKQYVAKNGGPLNAMLEFYNEITGKDPTQQAQQAIEKLKIQSKKSAKENEEMIKTRAKELEEYMKEGERVAKGYYDEKFGADGSYKHLQDKFIKAMNAYLKLMSSIFNPKRMKTLIDMIGYSLGPTGRAIMYIVYQPTELYSNQLFGPIILVPRIMSGDSDFWDKILALPPAIIALSGNQFKPLLMLWEPMMRWFMFVCNGDYTKSLNAGLELAHSYGLSTASASALAPMAGGKRRKRDTKTKDTAVKKGGWFQGGKFDKELDRRLAFAYQGGPPPNGYNLGIKDIGKIKIPKDDFVSRILLTPDFLMKAGGPVFAPTASVLAPVLRAVNTVLFGNGNLDKRVSEVPEILKGIGFVGPLAPIIKALQPMFEIIYKINQGEMKPGEVVVQAPILAKTLTNSVLWDAIKNPENIIKEMLQWLEGSGGILGVSKVQIEELPPKPNVRTPTLDLNGDDSNVILNYVSEYSGGQYLGYVQSTGPILSMLAALFNGVLGNLINPVKLLDTEIDLSQMPLKQFLKTFDSLSELSKCAEDKKAFAMALLGGIDPEVFVKVGINAGKLASVGIDPALLIMGGKKLLPPDMQKKVDSAPGLESNLMAQIDLNTKSFLENGILGTSLEKLHNAGIDENSLINRIMRGSVDDDVRLMNAGIDVKSMLKSGINPALLIGGGVGAIPEETLKQLGINKNSPGAEDIQKLGINAAKLQSKGIDPKKFVVSGIESFLKEQSTIGINAQTLMTSLYSGLNEKRLKKAGIDMKALLMSGIPTKHLLLGGIRNALKNDLSPKSLAKVGIELKDLKKTGVEITLLTEVGAGVLNPTQLFKLGVDPMRTMIGVLSQYGLDVLTGGIEDSRNFGIGFVTSVVQIIQSMFGGVDKMRNYSFGRMIYGPDGRWIGVPGFVFYKVLGIDAFGGLLGFFKTAFLNKLTMAEMLQLINPVRIVKELANIDQPGTFRRKKDPRKPLDDFKLKQLGKKGGVEEKSDEAQGESGKKEESEEEDSKAEKPTEKPSAKSKMPSFKKFG